MANDKLNNLEKTIKKDLAEEREKVFKQTFEGKSISVELCTFIPKELPQNNIETEQNKKRKIGLFDKLLGRNNRKEMQQKENVEIENKQVIVVRYGDDAIAFPIPPSPYVDFRLQSDGSFLTYFSPPYESAKPGKTQYEITSSESYDIHKLLQKEYPNLDENIGKYVLYKTYEMAELDLLAIPEYREAREKQNVNVANDLAVLQKLFPESPVVQLIKNNDTRENALKYIELLHARLSDGSFSIQLIEHQDKFEELLKREVERQQLKLDPLVKRFSLKETIELYENPPEHLMTVPTHILAYSLKNKELGRYIGAEQFNDQIYCLGFVGQDNTPNFTFIKKYENGSIGKVYLENTELLSQAQKKFNQNFITKLELSLSINDEYEKIQACKSLIDESQTIIAQAFISDQNKEYLEELIEGIEEIERDVIVATISKDDFGHEH